MCRKMMSQDVTQESPLMSEGGSAQLRLRESSCLIVSDMQLRESTSTLAEIYNLCKLIYMWVLFVFLQ